MLKILLAILMTVASEGNKFIKFLIEVFQGRTGDVLDKSYKIINEGVQNAENIGEYITEHKTDNLEAISDHISEKYGYILETADIEEIITHKGEGKYKLAFKLILNRLQAEKMEYTIQAINLGIEFAVNRFFGK